MAVLTYSHISLSSIIFSYMFRSHKNPNPLRVFNKILDISCLIIVCYGPHIIVTDVNLLSDWAGIQILVHGLWQSKYYLNIKR